MVRILEGFSPRRFGGKSVRLPPEEGEESSFPSRRSRSPGSRSTAKAKSSADPSELGELPRARHPSVWSLAGASASGAPSIVTQGGKFVHWSLIESRDVSLRWSE